MALIDCPESSGGFCCVPGFHKSINAWCEQPKIRSLCVKSATCSPVDPTSVIIPKDDPIQDHIQRIPLKAGSIVIWDSRLAHCNSPNNGPGHRIVQYVKMLQACDTSIRPVPLTE